MCLINKLLQYYTIPNWPLCSESVLHLFFNGGHHHLKEGLHPGLQTLTCHCRGLDIRDSIPVRKWKILWKLLTFWKTIRYLKWNGKFCEKLLASWKKREGLDTWNEMLLNLNGGRKGEFHKIELQDRKYFLPNVSKNGMNTKFTRLKKALETLGG
jgi:hypothetical protein